MFSSYWSGRRYWKECTIRESVSDPRHTHARARAHTHTHTHTHTYSVYCPSLHGDMPGFHIREPASPLPSRKVSWKPAETFLRPVRSWQLKLFNQHGDVISCSWCAWSFQEPRTLWQRNTALPVSWLSLFPVHSVVLQIARTSLLAQTVKNLPAMQETRAWSLGRKDPLEEEITTHSSILA